MIGLGSAKLSGSASVASASVTKTTGFQLGPDGFGASGGTTQTINYSNSILLDEIIENVQGGPNADVWITECADGKKTTIVGQTGGSVTRVGAGEITARAVSKSDFGGGGLAAQVGADACNPNNSQNQVRADVVHILDVISTLHLSPCQLAQIISDLPEQPTHREIDLMLTSISHDWHERQEFQDCLDRERLALPTFPPSIDKQ